MKLRELEDDLEGQAGRGGVVLDARLLDPGLIGHLSTYFLANDFRIALPSVGSNLPKVGQPVSKPRVMEWHAASSVRGIGKPKRKLEKQRRTRAVTLSELASEGPVLVVDVARGSLRLYNAHRVKVGTFVFRARTMRHYVRVTGMTSLWGLQPLPAEAYFVDGKRRNRYESLRVTLPPAIRLEHVFPRVFSTAFDGLVVDNLVLTLANVEHWSPHGKLWPGVNVAAVLHPGPNLQAAISGQLGPIRLFGTYVAGREELLLRSSSGATLDVGITVLTDLEILVETWLDLDEQIPDCSVFARAELRLGGALIPLWCDLPRDSGVLSFVNRDVRNVILDSTAPLEELMHGRDWLESLPQLGELGPWRLVEVTIAYDLATRENGYVSFCVETMRTWRYRPLPELQMPLLATYAVGRPAAADRSVSVRVEGTLVVGAAIFDLELDPYTGSFVGESREECSFEALVGHRLFERLRPQLELADAQAGYVHFLLTLSVSSNQATLHATNAKDAQVEQSHEWTFYV
jgi:hypothetical protein